MDVALDTIHRQTFRRGSKTYFNSSRLFPPPVKRDVFILYGFVRKADDFVDRVPSDMGGFYRFRESYRNAREGIPSGEIIIDSFVDLSRRTGFDPEWTEAFLCSMEMDLFKSEYNTIEETLEYIYGSAEVIGLFMARVLDLPAASHFYAQMLGRSMQYINFIRDIGEDLTLGRRYLPLAQTPLERLDNTAPLRDPGGFRAFMGYHLRKYREWQAVAERGFGYIPKRYRSPIVTASDMYNWTAEQIRKNPAVVFDRKVKPGKVRIVFHVLKNFLGACG
jgi:phytoene synthase